MKEKVILDIHFYDVRWKLTLNWPQTLHVFQNITTKHLNMKECDAEVLLEKKSKLMQNITLTGH